MKKFLLISIKRKWVKEKWFCEYCGDSLNYYHPSTQRSTYWCPTCRSWRLISYQIGKDHDIEKLDYYQINYLAPTGEGSMTVLYSKLVRLERECIERIISDVKVYSSKFYDQEFLQNLIPKSKKE